MLLRDQAVIWKSGDRGTLLRTRIHLARRRGEGEVGDITEREKKKRERGE